ncbi:hypothetical protein [Methylobacter tundripaludum]|uniref:hypothetical protein n=1 Tax=Methylobacter tundripaludum TaxID=173365 RepID=UPI00190F220C|nr:hypothetical protein [Methylobacter tundripaludum]
MNKPAHTKHAIQACIEACSRCHQVCLQTAMNYCLKACRDCAGSCREMASAHH